jgi:hypothetical protein
VVFVRLATLADHRPWGPVRARDDRIHRCGQLAEAIRSREAGGEPDARLRPNRSAAWDAVPQRQGEAWEGAFASANGTIELLIDGKDEPAPALVARAREVVAEFPALERRVEYYLARAAAEDAELASEIAALRISELRFNWSERPDEVEIVFEMGPDEKYWTCTYAGGELKDLTFD